nr:cysteine peptidase family C39 domain-containing protein [uncultured Prevotella sp.]
MKKKISYIHQPDSMLCGVACLKMVCEYLGKRYSMEYLNHLCSATTEGVSLLSIHHTAEKLGITSIGARCDITKLLPQFRSIIPCEVLLYIEVTFLGFIH